MYGKHFESMYTGSMVGAGALAFSVWGYVISHQRSPSFDVELNPKILATIIGEPEKGIVETINKFCEPDKKSRSKAEEGRKLIKLGEYLYHVVNGSEYDRLRNNEERREYWRNQKRKQNGDSKVEETGKEGFSDEHRNVLAHLNEVTGRQFRAPSLVLIRARMGEDGVTVDGVMKMIDRQVARWKGDEKMEEYLRPSTLFKKERFNEYYAAREMPVKSNKPEHKVNQI
jgi:uncharacterized phage protein (TIGR02220 family)